MILSSIFSSFKTSVFGVFSFWQDYRIFMIYFFSTTNTRTNKKLVWGWWLVELLIFYVACIFCICVFFLRIAPEFIRAAGFNNNYKPFWRFIETNGRSSLGNACGETDKSVVSWENPTTPEWILGLFSQSWGMDWGIVWFSHCGFVFLPFFPNTLVGVDVWHDSVFSPTRWSLLPLDLCCGSRKDAKGILLILFFLFDGVFEF